MHALHASSYIVGNDYLITVNGQQLMDQLTRTVHPIRHYLIKVAGPFQYRINNPIVGCLKDSKLYWERLGEVVKNDTFM